MKKKVKVVISLVAIISVSVTAIALYTTNNSENKNPFSIFDLIHDVGNPKYNYTDDVQIQKSNYLPSIKNNITGDYRPKYDIRDEEYEWIFGELPPFPSDFFQVLELVEDGKITDYARISPSYWKQPEFYVGWFSSLDLYNDNNPNTWIHSGYGCYPLIKQVSANAGNDIVVNTYFKSSYAVEAYQGLIVSPYLPESALSMTGVSLYDNPEDVEKYISVEITNENNQLYESFKNDIEKTNVNSSDWFTVLEPTYNPHLNYKGEITSYSGFPESWVRLLNLSVSISDDCPPGDYVVAIETLTPCFDINQEFYYSLEHEYYGKKYVPGGKIYKRTIPHFQLILEVN